MRRVRGNIFADGDPWLKGFLGLDWCPSDEAKLRARRYEEWIEYLIKLISKPASGFWILSEINGAASRKVVVKPWVPNPDAKPEDNASGLPYAKPTDYVAASPAGKPGKPVDLDHLADLEKPSNMGTGTGSDAVVRITPWWYLGAAPPNTSGLQADELLLHELIHAMNSVKGVLRVTGRGPAAFDDLDEFCAITFTNTYSSQTGRPLRRDHHGHEILPKPLWDGAAFYAAYSEEVNAVNKYHPDLVRIYKFWDSDKTFLPFNPFGPATTKTLPDM